MSSTATRLFAVRAAGAGLDHCYLGIEVKRTKAGFVPRAKARETLIRRAATRVVGECVV